MSAGGVDSLRESAARHVRRCGMLNTTSLRTARGILGGGRGGPVQREPRPRHVRPVSAADRARASSPSLICMYSMAKNNVISLFPHLLSPKPHTWSAPHRAMMWKATPTQYPRAIPVSGSRRSARVCERPRGLESKRTLQAQD